MGLMLLLQTVVTPGHQTVMTGLTVHKRIGKSVLCIIAVAFILPGVARAQETVKGIEKKDLKQVSYPELGWTSYGITLGYWHKRIGLRLANYYFDEDSNGMRINLGYKLSDNEKTQQSLNLVTGRFVGSDPGADYDFAYAGITYGINFSILRFSGLFFEIGLGNVLQDNLGNVADDPVVPCANIGYLYRFTPKSKK